MPAGAGGLSAFRNRSAGADALVAGGLAALAAAEITLTEGQFSVRSHLVEAMSVATVACFALLLRRRFPLLTAALALCGVLTTATLGIAPQAWLLPYLCVVAYSTGAFADDWQSAGGLVTCVVAGWVVASSAVDGTARTDYLWTVVMLGVSWAAGFGLRRRGESAVADRREALAEQRAVIARELHDVVAHSLTVIVVTSDAAELGLRRDPALAEAPLRTIRTVAQDALAEMRRLVGILRVGDPGGPTPQPGLALLDELADTMSATGLPVALTVEGDLSTIPPGPDLAGYRIVQEALTNARRHARGATGAQVTVRRSPDSLEIEVVDDGRPGPATGRSGHGLVGLAERVALYEGSFEAAGRSAGGFRVAASLPLEPPR